MKCSAFTFLSLFAGAASCCSADSAARVPLLFRGTLLDDSSKSIPNARVQFWQTDSRGVYNHPKSLSDRGGGLELGFQYFGTDLTDNNGEFSFKTYKPGLYPSRPIAHIHFKVFVGDEDVLTSQFYFAGESKGSPSMLTLDLEEIADHNGAVSWITNKTVAVNLGGGRAEFLTPSQTAGPYYPVVDFFDYDNDLTRTTSSVAETTFPSPVDQTLIESPTASPKGITQSAYNTPSPRLIDESETGAKSMAFSKDTHCELFLLGLCIVLIAVL